MKNFHRSMWIIVVLMVLLSVAGVTALLYSGTDTVDKVYQIEINRWMNRLTEEDVENPGRAGWTFREDGIYAAADYIKLNALGCKELREVLYLEADSTAERLEGYLSGFYVPSGMEFQTRPLFGEEGRIMGYFCFVYKKSLIGYPQKTMLLAGVCLAAAFLLLLGFFFYIKYIVLKPFYKLQELPYELSKGRLTRNLKEEKNRMYGRFLWGLDMLRESLEEHKKRELKLEKEKKMMILTISHDIKTPLSAIRLYTKALKENLYEGEEKRGEALQAIYQNTEQIEEFIHEIMKMSTTELMSLNVTVADFYLAELLKQVEEQYKERLALLMIDFKIEPYVNRMLSGDIDRLVEVFGNLIENASKYGDGGSIRILFSEEDFRQLITVENTGIPLAPAALVHVFESFWRGENAYDKEGSGLGLFICRQLMRDMDGDIFAEAWENGMRFTLVIR